MDTTSTERSARIRQATPAEHIVTSAMAVKHGTIRGPQMNDLPLDQSIVRFPGG